MTISTVGRIDSSNRKRNNVADSYYTTLLLQPYSRFLLSHNLTQDGDYLFSYKGIGELRELIKH